MTDRLDDLLALLRSQPVDGSGWRVTVRAAGKVVWAGEANDADHAMERGLAKL